MATWFQGTRRRVHRGEPRRDTTSGVRILHFLGGMSVDVAGAARDRADQDDDLAARRASTACRAMSCAPVGSLISSRSATGAGEWCCASRSTRRTGSIRSIPSAPLALDQDLLARFPEGYRHLAYLQTHIGYTVKPDMPGLEGPEVEQLYKDGAVWLSGEPLRR